MLATLVNSLRAAFGAPPLTGVGEIVGALRAGPHADIQGANNMPNTIDTFDMSVYAPETLFNNSLKSFEDGIPILNDLVLKGYISAIDNWKLNRDRGTSAPIPDPPLAYALKIDRPNMTFAVVRETPICEKWVEPAPTPQPSKAGVLMPPFAPGRYLAILGDNAPAGHRLTTPDGVLVEKIMTPWFAGFSVEYRKVA